MNRMLAVAGREVRLALRNRWIVAAMVLLLGLALALHALGTLPGGAVRADALSIAVVGLTALSVYLVPLLAVMLSFDAFVDERERGTLALLLTCPLQRVEILGGKLLGHAIVLGLAIGAGYGIAAIVIGTTADSAWQGLHGFLRMMLSSWLLGLVFVALGYLVSILVRERASATASALGLWLLLVVLYDLALIGAALLDQGRFLDPHAFAWLVMLNPTDAYRLFNLATDGAVSRAAGLLGIAVELPAGPHALLAVLAGWALAPLAAVLWQLRRYEP